MTSSATPLDPAWEAALNRAVEGSLREADSHLFLEDREDLTVESEPGNAHRSTQTRHLGIAAFHGGTERRHAFLSDPSPDDVARLVAAAAGERTRVPPRASVATARPSGLDPRGPGALVARVEDETVKALPPRTNLDSIRWIGFQQHVVIARPGQPIVLDQRRGARLRIEARAETPSGWTRVVEECVLGDPSGSPTAETEQLSIRVARRAAERRVLKDPRRGEQRIVFAAGVGGVWLHEVVGHALEGDTAARGSWLAGRTDAVTDRAAVIVDDPRRGRAAWKVDDEGEPARSTPLILGGRVRGTLLDRAWASHSGGTSTGHGRRASFREPLLPRMGCTFLGAGSLPAAEVVAGTTGLYIRRMESAHTDPRTGRAVFRVTDADELFEGRRTGAVKPFLLHVDGPASLAGLDRIGDDLRFDVCIGSCHREGQALPVSVGAPTIRIGVAGVAK